MALLNTIIIVTVMHWGNVQFSGMEGGVLVNTAWMLHLGYIPYRDFLTAVPPLFLLGAKASFLFRDVPSWNAMLGFTSAFSCLFANLSFLH